MYNVLVNFFHIAHCSLAPPSTQELLASAHLAQSDAVRSTVSYNLRCLRLRLKDETVTAGQGGEGEGAGWLHASSVPLLCLDINDLSALLLPPEAGVGAGATRPGSGAVQGGRDFVLLD